MPKRFNRHLIGRIKPTDCLLIGRCFHAHTTLPGRGRQNLPAPDGSDTCRYARAKALEEERRRGDVPRAHPARECGLPTNFVAHTLKNTVWTPPHHWQSKDHTSEPQRLS